MAEKLIVSPILACVGEFMVIEGAAAEIAPSIIFINFTVRAGWLSSFSLSPSSAMC